MIKKRVAINGFRRIGRLALGPFSINKRTFFSI